MSIIVGEIIGIVIGLVLSWFVVLPFLDWLLHPEYHHESWWKKVWPW